MKQFPLTTLIRLYELLKNSRLKPQMRRQQQRSLAFQGSSRFGVETQAVGGG